MATPLGFEPRKKLRFTRFNCINRDVFYIYVLHSVADQGFYIGYSKDLKKRLAEHKQRASIATRHRGPWKLIYYEAYTDPLDARGRERYLKSGGGRRFLHQQLRHYLKKFPHRSTA